MHYKNLKSFFESIIGYNGSSWESDLDKKDAPWLLHDMEKMIKEHVGYPSLLHLLVVISFLGYCASPEDKECKVAGDWKDFKFFCNEYLKEVDTEYTWDQKGKKLWEIVRNKLAHVYFTKNAITTDEHQDHLKIKKGDSGPYLFISVGNLWKETKGAIELLYKDISKGSKREGIFLKKLDFLDKWQWELNKRVLESKSLIEPIEGESSSSGPSGPNMPLSGALGP